jgi:hypothetical protein
MVALTVHAMLNGIEGETPNESVILVEKVGQEVAAWRPWPPTVRSA